MQSFGYEPKRMSNQIIRFDICPTTNLALLQGGHRASTAPQPSSYEKAVNAGGTLCGISYRLHHAVSGIGPRLVRRIYVDQVRLGVNGLSLVCQRRLRNLKVDFQHYAFYFSTLHASTYSFTLEEPEFNIVLCFVLFVKLSFKSSKTICSYSILIVTVQHQGITMPSSIPEVVLCGDTIRDDERYSQADQLTSVRRSHVVETVKINPECIGREQAESIDSKRREQAIEFKRLDHLWGVSGENITSMHESRQRIQRLELEINYLWSRKQLLRRNDDVLLDGLMILPGCQALTIGDFCRESIDIDHPKLTEGVEVYGSSYNMHKGSSGGLLHNQLSPLHPASLDGPWRNKDGDDSLVPDSYSTSQQRFDYPHKRLTTYNGTCSTASRWPPFGYLLNDKKRFSNYIINKSHETRRTISEGHPSHIQNLAHFEDFANESKMVIPAWFALWQESMDLIVGRKAKHIQFSQLTGAENRQPRSDVSGPVTLGKTVSGLLLLG